MSELTDFEVVRYSGDSFSRVRDAVVVESPVEFRLNGVPIAVLMRTPGYEEDLGLGFALTEGIALSPSEVTGVSRRSGNDQGDRFDLIFSPEVEIDPEQFRRNLYTTSSCGVCGKTSIDAVRVAALPLPTGPIVTPDLLLDLPEKMKGSQSAFHRTGGLHAAAVFSSEGDLIVVREDVGRHNAVDKVVGWLARRTWPLGDVILLVSGRISFEMVQKAAVAGVPIICGVSAASSLAVELGIELGSTVVGFLREGGFNVYADKGRII